MSSSGGGGVEGIVGVGFCVGVGIVFCVGVGTGFRFGGGVGGSSTTTSFSTISRSFLSATSCA
jgi:hypothetical protein